MHVIVFCESSFRSMLSKRNQFLCLKHYLLLETTNVHLPCGLGYFILLGYLT